MEKFEGEIKKVDEKDASYIEIPFDVQQIFGSKRVKVKATFDGIEYRGSIVNMGMDCHIIGLTKELRGKINKTFGDKVLVTVEKDEEERTIEVTDDFRTKIEEDEDVLQFWNGLSFSAKKKYVTWITSAKKEETKVKRIEEAIDKLRSKKKI